jgi:hypothetical protein
MTELDLQSERYVATGNIASEGLRNQLGRPAADPLTVLVRETVQNSWDARVSAAEKVEYSLTRWTGSKSQTSFLKDVIFSRVPREIPLGDSLKKDEAMAFLCISDRGTCGLGGPTRADAPLSDGEASHFVNFVRNVGKPKSASLSGGTYGYGKSSLFSISNAKAICVHTRCRVGNGFESRFIGVGWGSSYSTKSGSEAGAFTGRHWWGLRASDGVVDPLVGEPADGVADNLGLPRFGEGETGLNLLVVDPNFGPRSASQAAAFLKETVLWYFWPKMMERLGGPAPMSFRVNWEGSETDLKLPSDRAPFSAFISAMENLKSYQNGKKVTAGSRVDEIWMLSPKRLLGHLALGLWPALTEGVVVLNDESPAPFQGPAHHVALMRGAELVVKYLAGPPAITGAFQWAGVFMPVPNVDSSFAASEPPAHDDWVPAAVLDPQMKKNVNVALRRIKETANAFAAPGLPQLEGDGDIPLGAFAEVLGNLLPTADIGRRENDPAARTIKKRPSKPKIDFVDSGSLYDGGTGPAISLRFKVESVRGSKGTKVSVAAQVAIVDGSGREAEPPTGEDIPKVLQWWSPEEDPLGDASSIVIPANNDGVWIVAVTMPGEFAVAVDLDAEAVK